MIRCLSFALLLACAAGSAQAQLRSIPADAKRAAMSHVEGMIVEIGGKRFELAPGAQIRDTHNRIVLPAALPSGSPVKYTLDAQEKLFRAWILTPEEKAQRDPPAK